MTTAPTSEPARRQASGGTNGHSARPRAGQQRRRSGKRSKRGSGRREMRRRSESMTNDAVETEQAMEFLRGILERMGIAAKVKLHEEEDERVLDIECEMEDDVQRVIGRRGQVVDALQHLVGKMLVKGKASGERGASRSWSTPAATASGTSSGSRGWRRGWRRRRRPRGQPVELNPMPAHDRRIVHMAIANVDGRVDAAARARASSPHRASCPGLSAAPAACDRRRRHDRRDRDRRPVRAGSGSCGVSGPAAVDDRRAADRPEPASCADRRLRARGGARPGDRRAASTRCWRW